jgi:hypothetical protein
VAVETADVATAKNMVLPLKLKSTAEGVCRGSDRFFHHILLPEG